MRGCVVKASIIGLGYVGLPLALVVVASGKDVHVAHCPGRINPGDQNWTVRIIQRVLAGNCAEAAQRAQRHGYPRPRPLLQAERGRRPRVSLIRGHQALKGEEGPGEVFDPYFPGHSTVDSLEEGLEKCRCVLLVTAPREFIDPSLYEGVGMVLTRARSSCTIVCTIGGRACRR